MGDFITALLTQFSLANFWNTIEPVAPFIGVAILVSIGYMVLRKTVGGAGKGKAKI